MNTTKNPPPGDQGLAFQTHALQMILFGPFYVRTRYCYGPSRIVSLLLLRSVANRVLTISIKDVTCNLTVRFSKFTLNINIYDEFVGFLSKLVWRETLFFSFISQYQVRIIPFQWKIFHATFHLFIYLFFLLMFLRSKNQCPTCDVKN